MKAVIELLKQNNELYDLFVRAEEYDTKLSDKLQRFPYYASRNRNIFEPEVSKFFIKNGLKVEYPEKKKFAVFLTHDIDAVNYPKLNIIKNFAVSLIRDRIIYKNTNNWRNFKDIMSIEEKYGAKSSFFFLALNTGDLDFNYEIENSNYEMGNIIDNGWEIGLHGGHEAFNNLNVIKEQKKRLENVLGKGVIGYRNHNLRFKVPVTWELLSKAGFKYDTTLGYADCAGFRNGMCHPYKPFNLEKKKEIDILEIPLTIMDRTLFDYMRLDMKSAWDLTKHLIDTVEKYCGTITILWHNTNMVGENLKFYENILKYCSDKNAWMPNGEEIFNNWS